MKRSLLTALFSFWTVFISAQKDSAAIPGAVVHPVSKENSIVKEPEFPGGHKAFSMQVYANFRTYQLSKLDIRRASAVASFYVETDGSMSEIKIDTYDHELVKNEFLRALRSIKTSWTPGEENGKKVRRLMKQPLTFILEP